MTEYSLNPLQDDCYENSTVLKNKFNIHDAEKLDIMPSCSLGLNFGSTISGRFIMFL